MPVISGGSVIGEAASGLQNARIIKFAGVPVDGTSGTGLGAEKGTLLIDITNANVYINRNTAASPTWVLVGPPA